MRAKIILRSDLGARRAWKRTNSFTACSAHSRSGCSIGRVAAGGQVCDAVAGGQDVGASGRWHDRPAQSRSAAVGHRIPIRREPADLHSDRPENGCGPGRIPDAGGPGRHLLRRTTTRSAHQTVDQPGTFDRAGGRTATPSETQSRPSAGSRLSATKSAKSEDLLRGLQRGLPRPWSSCWRASGAG